MRGFASFLFVPALSSSIIAVVRRSESIFDSFIAKLFELLVRECGSIVISNTLNLPPTL